MKKALQVFLILLFFYSSIAQPPRDTTTTDTLKLIQQKENIITASTIIKVENMGAVVNTDRNELRPTISADGNLLFFIRENDPHNTNYNSVRNSQDIWFSMRDENGTW